MNISDIYDKIKAVNKTTGEEKKVNLICLSSKTFNSPDDEWGKWHNFSKRGDWNLILST